VYVTPLQVAVVLGVSVGRITTFLRVTYPKHPRNAHWRLSAVMVLAVVEYFGLKA